MEFLPRLILPPAPDAYTTADDDNNTGALSNSYNTSMRFVFDL